MLDPFFFTGNLSPSNPLVVSAVFVGILIVPHGPGRAVGSFKREPSKGDALNIVSVVVKASNMHLWERGLTLEETCGMLKFVMEGFSGPVYSLCHENMTVKCRIAVLYLWIYCC